MALAFLILSTLLIVALGVATPFFLNWLAAEDVLVTHVKEGTAKAIMRGKSFNHFVMSLKGCHLNDPSMKWFDRTKPAWEVLENIPGIDYKDRNLLMRWLGLYWVGIPGLRSVYRYDFEWNEMRLEPGTGKQIIWSRAAETDFIYVVAFPYAMILSKAETKDRLPVDALYQLTVRSNNPFMALFDTENWMEIVSGAANRRARNFIGSNTYSSLVSETDGATKTEQERDSFSCPITNLSKELPDDSSDNPRKGLSGKYGITAIAADLQDIDLAGPRAAEILDATVKAYTADQTAYATTVAGTAEANAILAKGTAEANVVSLKGKAEAKSLLYRLAAIRQGGEQGALLAQLDAMSAPGLGKSVYWANNPFIQSKPGLADLLTTLGIKTPEEFKAFIRNSVTEETQDA